MKRSKISQRQDGYSCDDEDRENEGDLCMAAESHPEAINLWQSTAGASSAFP
jgi:3,4-dihydroxy-2-butanone 4-phosphate synthase